MIEGMNDLLAQLRKPPIPEAGDYTGKDGLLYCGKCRTPKQVTVEIEIGGVKRLAHPTCMCQCEVEKYQQEKAEEKRKKDMERVMSLKRQSLMDERFRQSTFDRFTVTDYNGIAYRACKLYADDFPTYYRENKGMLLYGDVGTGKTYAAACIANQLLNKGIPVVMTSFVKIMAASKFGDGDAELIEAFSHAALLIIDDLGAERGSDFALERMYNILDSRWQSNKPLILTTNLTVKEMSDATDNRAKRIYDRVFSMCPLQLPFGGPSWRKIEAAHGFESMRHLMEEES